MIFGQCKHLAEIAPDRLLAPLTPDELDALTGGQNDPVDCVRPSAVAYAMSIMLTKEHEDWLRAKVAAGEFASLDEAVKAAVQRLIIDDERDDDDDLMWAEPFAAEGLAQLERGERVSHEEVFTNLQRLIQQFSM